MKKKIPLKEVSGKRWRVKKGDRSSFNTAKAAVNAEKSAVSIEEMAYRQMEILEELLKVTDSIALQNRKPQVPAKQAPIEVVVPRPAKINKKFRFKISNIVRDEDERMIYADIDVEQL